MSEFRQRLLQSHGVRRLIEAIVDGLRQARSTLLLIPVGAPRAATITAALVEALGDQADLPPLGAAATAADTLPAATTARLLGLQGQPSTADELYRLSDEQGLTRLPFLLIDVQSISVRGDWIAWAQEWAQSSQARSGLRPVTAMVLLLPASRLGPQPIQSNVLLDVRRWWAVASSFDLRLACHDRLDVKTLAERSPTEIWREGVLPSFVSGDINLALRLWDDCLRDFDFLFKQLSEMAQQRGYRSEQIEQWNARKGPDAVNGPYAAGPSLSGPPTWARELWEQGMLCWTPEYGLELHPIALAALNRKADLRHRLWRGQVAVVMPIVDQIRMLACEHLIVQLRGTRWTEQHLPIHYRDHQQHYNSNPLDCELSHVLPNLRTLRSRSGRTAAGVDMSLMIEHVNRVRRDIAHYRPISFEQFERLYNALGRLDRSVTEHPL